MVTLLSEAWMVIGTFGKPTTSHLWQTKTSKLGL